MSSEKVIGRIATIVTLACVAVVAVTAIALAKPGVRSWLGLQTGRQPAYKVGDRIDVPSTLYRQTPYTLLLFIRSNCGACQSAKPGMAELVARLKNMSVPTVVIASGTHADDESAYARDLGLGASQLVALDLSTLHLQVVPTLVLVNEKGEVKYAKEGVPSDADRQALAHAADLSLMTR